MKKKLTFIVLAAMALASITALQGCVRDSLKRTYSYTIFTPVYKTKAQVRENIRANSPRALQNTGKLYTFGSTIFLNEIDKGIHVIDNSNPSNPVNLGFIDIPGNRDLAVKGNVLYADLYTDLVAIDISDPAHVQVTKVVENVFPHRFYDARFNMDTTKVIVDWLRKDTTVVEHSNLGGWWGVEKDSRLFVASAQGSGGSLASAAAPAGMGGSMARFAIADKVLYTVGISDLRVFNIAEAANPVYQAMKSVGMNIETIFPFREKLFIGSSNGMYIYDIANPLNPVQQSQFTHVRSCDPVIADDKYAYVTLRSGTVCTGFTNQLELLDIANLSSPKLIKVYPMTNPHGLSKEGNTLFICDGRDGLKIYNAADPNNLQLLKTVPGIETFDVIAWDKRAIVVAKDGLYQYDYSDLTNIRLLSKIGIVK
jgi:hypothetical protein